MKWRILHLNPGANGVRFAPLFKCKRLPPSWQESSGLAKLLGAGPGEEDRPRETIQTLSAASTDPCRPRGEGSSWSGSKAGPNGCVSRRRRALKRQSERCSKAATTLDLSENSGEKTLIHLLRDLTAKWGFRSGFNCKIGLQMRCSAI
jgi:hypothetical protein